MAREGPLQTGKVGCRTTDPHRAAAAAHGLSLPSAPWSTSVCSLIRQSTAEEMGERRGVYIVGVGGPSGSGKSTIAVEIAEALNSPFAPVNFDTYL